MTSQAHGTPDVVIEDLHKSYAGVRVLRGVDLTVRGGEIHALLGANGAGKSTLIKCISGAERPDSGTVTIGGVPLSAQTPAEARDTGIVVVHQTPAVAMGLNVADNIMLGAEPGNRFFRRPREARRTAADLLERLGADISPDAPLDTLGNADLQIVEIAKALVRRPKVLILDEPTAALSEREVIRLAAQMRMLRKEGLPLLFVTHRLGEALELSDHVSVLRGGEVVLSGRATALDRDRMVDSITGKARTAAARVAGPARGSSVRVLEVEGLGGPGVGPLDLMVREGEVVGLYGLVGSGRTELLETLFGARKASAGTVRVAGAAVRLGSPQEAVRDGVSLVASDRLRKSVFPTLSAQLNVTLPWLGRLGRRRFFRSAREESDTFSRAAASLDLQPLRPDLEAGRFSGGNQQKLVIGRWLSAANRCRVLLLDEPTDGVDIGARADLYAAIGAFAACGNGVILASSEPEELIQVAHRVVVLARGRVVSELTRSELSETTLVDLAHAGESADSDKEERDVVAC